MSSDSLEFSPSPPPSTPRLAPLPSVPQSGVSPPVLTNNVPQTTVPIFQLPPTGVNVPQVPYHTGFGYPQAQVQVGPAQPGNHPLGGQLGELVIFVTLKLFTD